MQKTVLNISLICLAVFTVFKISILFKAGFDFTDEGFYLNSIAFSDHYDGTTTQFGAIYKPLYSVFSGDVFAIRVINGLGIYALSFIAFYIALKTRTIQQSLSQRIALASVLAINSYLYLIYWLPSPNYNTLNQTALWLCAISILLLDKSRTANHIKYFPYALLGLSGWLSFMAKPTSALILGVVIFLMLVVKGKNSLSKGLTISVTLAFVLLISSAYYIDGSLEAFIARLNLGLERGNLLYENSRSFSSLIWNGSISSQFYIIALVITCSNLLLLYHEHKNVRLGESVSNRKIISYALYGAVIICLALVIHLQDLNERPASLVLQFNLTLIITIIALILIELGLICLKQRSMLRVNHIKTVTLLSLPYVYVFGTGNNYFIAASSAAGFILLAVVYYLSQSNTITSILQKIYVLACVSLALNTVTLINSAEHPYRQKVSIKMQSKLGATSIGNLRNISLSSDSEEYLRKLNKDIRAAGFAPGTSVIDLTGRSPGVLYALQSKPLAAGWILGGYKGSSERALFDLSAVEFSSLKKAWILLEPEGERAISIDILTKLNLEFPADYELITTIKPPIKSTQNQKVYRPKQR